MQRASVRLYACAIGFAAMAAAGLGHAAVDLLAYAHAFSGAYGRYQHTGIGVALIAVAAMAFGFVTASVVAATIAQLRHRFGVDSGASIAAMIRPRASTLPLVFCVQLAMLVGVETLEQIQRFGHPLGLAASFGGPVLIALAIHAFFAVIGAFGSFGVLRSFARALAAIARVVIPLVLRVAVAAAAVAGAPVRAANALRRTPSGAPLALRIANRPPPRFACS